MKLDFAVYLHNDTNMPMLTAPKDSPRSAQADAIASLLRTTAGRLKRRLREQSGAADLTPSQTSVLLRLESEGPATTSALARAEGMRSQSMGVLITSLQTAGLVESRPDPEDKRQTILSLTSSCRQRIEEGRAARQDWLSRIIDARLSDEEQDLLAAALPLLDRLLAD
jgi:DNA-binding MarR family transcriptional regulator